MPEHDDLPGATERPGAAERPGATELLDAIDHQHDRRDAWVAVVISAVALGVMLVASLLLIVSAARS